MPRAGRYQIVGACIDVDSRRRAERYSDAGDDLGDDARSRRSDGSQWASQFTNPAFDRMFGRELDELSGTSVKDLLDRRQNDRSTPLGVEGLLDQPDGRGGKRDIVFRRRDGTQFVGEVVFADLEWSGEKKTLVVVQDVSERKQLEAEIIEVANHERRRLAADLHDGLGQELTGVSLMLRSLATRTGSIAFQSIPRSTRSLPW